MSISRLSFIFFLTFTFHNHPKLSDFNWLKDDDDTELNKTPFKDGIELCVDLPTEFELLDEREIRAQKIRKEIDNLFDYHYNNTPYRRKQSDCQEDVEEKHENEIEQKKETYNFDNFTGVLQNFKHVFLEQDISPWLASRVIESAPEQVKLVIEATKNPQFRSLSVGKLLLLVGKPGTGKSSLAKAIAQETKRQLIFIPAALVADQYKNSGEQNLAQLILAVKESQIPTVIVLDEINTIANEKEGSNDPNANTPQALWTLIDQCLETPNILFIGTTNSAKKIPKPLAQRLGPNIVEMPTNNIEMQKDIICHYLLKKRHSCTEDYLEKIAKQLKNYSPRQLESIIQNAYVKSCKKNEYPGIITPKEINDSIKTYDESQSLAEQSALEKIQEGCSFQNVCLGIMTFCTVYNTFLKNDSPNTPPSDKTPGGGESNSLHYTPNPSR